MTEIVTRRFLCFEGNNKRFWNVTLDCCTVTTVEGRLGSEEQATALTTTFETSDSAAHHVTWAVNAMIAVHFAEVHDEPPAWPPPEEV